MSDDLDAGIPQYDHEYTVGESTEWDDLPTNVIPIAEGENDVKIALIDQPQVDTVHAEKKALRTFSFDSVEEFRESVDWDYYSE